MGIEAFGSVAAGAVGDYIVTENFFVVFVVFFGCVVFGFWVVGGFTGVAFY